VRHWIGLGFRSLEELARRYGDGTHYYMATTSRWPTCASRRRCTTRGAIIWT
jgi:hypothetical protein